MGDSVWIQLFAQAVSFISNLLKSSSNPKHQSNGGASPSVPVNAADSMLILPNVPTLVITRNPKLETTDGVFGEMVLQNELVGYTAENKAKMILAGVYNAKLDLSPRLRYVCPHIAVPERDKAAGGDAGIRIHILNAPCQSEGCVGVGTAVDGDAVDNSRAAFDALISKLPSAFLVNIS